MFTLPDLPYAYNALEPWIDERTMQIHHDKHHAAYVKNVNDALAGHDDLLVMSIEDLMKNLGNVPEEIRTRVKNNGGGILNHNFFWQIMQPASNVMAEQRWDSILPVVEKIDNQYGGLDKFKEQFAASALGIFGSGWCWLDSDLKIITTPNQDTISNPILGLDVWEHAYYLKYQNMRADYIKAWWNVVNWKEVDRKFHAA